MISCVACDGLCVVGFKDDDGEWAWFCESCGWVQFQRLTKKHNPPGEYRKNWRPTKEQIDAYWRPACDKCDGAMVDKVEKSFVYVVGDGRKEVELAYLECERCGYRLNRYPPGPAYGIVPRGMAAPLLDLEWEPPANEMGGSARWRCPICGEWREAGLADDVPYDGMQLRCPRCAKTFRVRQYLEEEDS